MTQPVRVSVCLRREEGLRWNRALLFTLLALASAVYAGYRLFIGFSFYDDEGTLLLMSRWTGEGRAAYRDFHSIYGPFYFLYRWAAHAAAGQMSHTVGRLIAIVPWTVAALAAFAYTLRLTRSRIAALTAWAVCLRLLAFIAAEPAHPQEICILLVIGIAAATVRRTGPLQFAATGALLAALVLTKVNLGVYTGAAVAIAAVAATRFAAFRYIALPLVAGAALAGPVLLMAPLLHVPWVRELCALVLLSTGTVLAAIVYCPPEATLGIRQWSALAGGFGATAAAVLAWAIQRGATLQSMAQSTILDNLQQAHGWTVPLKAGVGGIVAMAASLASLALWLRWRHRAIHWVKFAVGCATLALLLANRPAAAFAFGLSFAWLVIVPRSGWGPPRFARVLLGAVTALHAVSAYPVAGSQLRFTTVLFAIAAILCLSDSVAVLARRSSVPSWLAAGVPLAVFVLSIAGAIRLYAHLSPLGLPGTAGIHVDAGDRANYQWAAAKLKSSCDSFVAFPAMYSLYAWVRQPAPPYPDLDGWQPYVSQERQSLEKHLLEGPRSCVLLIERLVPFWLPAHDAARMTLLGYIQRNFTEIDSRSGFKLMVRKPPTDAAPIY